MKTLGIVFFTHESILQNTGLSFNDSGEFGLYVDWIPSWATDVGISFLPFGVSYTVGLQIPETL